MGQVATLPWMRVQRSLPGRTLYSLARPSQAYSVAYTHPVAEGVDLELKYGKVSNGGADDSMIRLTTMVGF